MIERMTGSDRAALSVAQGAPGLQRWYLIHTKPAGELTAEANLLRQEYEVYLPRILQPSRRSGRWRDRIAVLFPRYLFLRLNEGRQSLGPVRCSIGVSGVVRFGLKYAVVPDEIVSGLQAREDPGSGLHRVTRPIALTPGETVGINGGLFDGLEGIFERDAGAERVVVLLRLLGHEVAVQVPGRFVQSGRAA
jgi:transcriptional antiterminator RfaH